MQPIFKIGIIFYLFKISCFMINFQLTSQRLIGLFRAIYCAYPPFEYRSWIKITSKFCPVDFSDFWERFLLQLWKNFIKFCALFWLLCIFCLFLKKWSINLVIGYNIFLWVNFMIFSKDKRIYLSCITVVCLWSFLSLTSRQDTKNNNLAVLIFTSLWTY